MECARRAEGNSKRPPPQPAPPVAPVNTAAETPGGYSILDQVFPQAQAIVSAPSPSQYAPPPPSQTFPPPYPTPQVLHQEMPPNTGGPQSAGGNGGVDILGRLFEDARQRGLPGGY